MAVDNKALASSIAQVKALLDELQKIAREGCEEHYVMRMPVTAERYLAAAGLLHTMSLQADTVARFVLGSYVAGDWQPMIEAGTAPTPREVFAAVPSWRRSRRPGARFKR